MLPGHYTRGGRVGANCVNCEMVPVVTRAQYLHLNYVAGETEGGGREREGSSLVPRLSPPKEPGNEAIARKETMERTINGKGLEMTVIASLVPRPHPAHISLPV